MNPFIKDPLLFVRTMIATKGCMVCEHLSESSAFKMVAREGFGIRFVEWLYVGLDRIKVTHPKLYEVIDRKGCEIING